MTPEEEDQKFEKVLEMFESFKRSIKEDTHVWRSLIESFQNPALKLAGEKLRGKSAADMESLIFEDLRPRLSQLLDCVNTEGIRSKILLFSAEIELALENVISNKLLPPRAKRAKDDELFRRMAPLSTFSSKIAIAYRLGVINKDRADALDTLRGLRNECAHNVEGVSVDTLAISPEVKDFIRLTAKAAPYALPVVLVATGVYPIHEKSFAMCCFEHVSYLWGASKAIERLADSFPFYASILDSSSGDS